MDNCRAFPAAEPRVETGPIQFGDDWPGTFIRGDNAFAHAMNLQVAIAALETSGDAATLIFTVAGLKGLLSDLQSSRVSHSATVSQENK